MQDGKLIMRITMVVGKWVQKSDLNTETSGRQAEEKDEGVCERVKERKRERVPGWWVTSTVDEVLRMTRCHYQPREGCGECVCKQKDPEYYRDQSFHHDSSLEQDGKASWGQDIDGPS